MLYNKAWLLQYFWEIMGDTLYPVYGMDTSTDTILRVGTMAGYWGFPG
jgi:hypothetical protein